MRLSRRRLLQLGAGLAAASVTRDRLVLAQAPLASGDAAQDRHTAELLHEFILQRAASSEDPWVEMHVVLALGASFERSGKNLLDEVVAKTLKVQAVGMRQYPYFPLETERHPFHFLQIMQATGVPYDHVFNTPVGRFTRRELIDGATALFEPSAIKDELSWTLSVLCQEFPPDRGRFTNAHGTQVVVEDLVMKHLRDAEEAYAPVFAVMAGTKGYGKGPLHFKACNGTHLLYGLVDALHFGYSAHELKAHVEKLVGATLFRLRFEPVLIDRSMPGVPLNADAAKFTFVGHVVEVLGVAKRDDVLQFSPAALAAIAGARGDLAELTERLTSQHDIDRLSRDVPQAYKLVLGDACHAYRGIRLWT